MRSPQVTPMSLRAGTPTVLCRVACSALIAAPLLYWATVTHGDAYLFLAMTLLASTAGFVLFANSLYCLFRYRTWESAVICLFFIGLSLIGVVTAAYFLPQFRM